MDYKYNEQIKLAWRLYRKVYRGTLSPVAFLIGDMLYEYALSLSSDKTNIISDYFIFSYKKEDIAKDIGVSESSLRVAKKTYNGMSVWKELETIGFIIENGKKGKNSNFYIPLRSSVKLEPKIGKFYVNKFGEDKTRQYIQNLKEKLDGSYFEKVTKKWNEIDYLNENINNYRLFDKDNELQKQTKIQRQLFCLLAKKEIDVIREGKEIFKLFGSIVKYVSKYGNPNYFIIENAIFNLYHNYKEKIDLKQFYGLLKYTIDNEALILEAQHYGYSRRDVEKDLIKQRIGKRQANKNNLELSNKKSTTVNASNIHNNSQPKESTISHINNTYDIEELDLFNQFYNASTDYFEIERINDLLL